jgi:hypothetical protein
MLWIKRNLFLALGGLIAVLLLGAGIFFFLGAKAKNEQLEEEIGATTNTLNNLYNAPVFPGVSNIETAKRETEKLRAVVGRMQMLFVPVPSEKVTGLAFRSYRDNTLAELHRMAEEARTTLPGKGYAFSFETQRSKVDFKEGTFPAIPQQMAEVKAVCKILFDAHVDPLVNLRRTRVSKDDEESNAASDYHFLKILTNAETETVTSPYEVTFNCLSSDLAAVLQGFLSSPHGLIVKAIQAEPAVEVAAANPAGAPPGPVGTVPRRQVPPAQIPAGVAPKAGAADKPVILLKERRVKVTLLIYVMRAAK